MKSIMYHYVRRFSRDSPYSRHKDIKLFNEEILKLKNNYFFNVTEAINDFNNIKQQSKSILLTFDDGIKDHLEVAEILHKLSIKATFYIPIQPYIDGKLLNVHKAHLIISKFGACSLDMLLELCQSLDIDYKVLVNKKEQEFFESRYQQQEDERKIKEFKKIINYCGSIGLRDKILDTLLEKNKINKKASEFYLTIEEIKYISSLGFEIGSHGVSHSVMSRLSDKEQQNEMYNSKKFLENVIQNSVTSFCYPYGRRNSYNEKSLDLLRQTNYKNAISVESRDINKNDIINNIYELPRYDCNEIERIF